MQDVVVVGAGLAGLAVAASLATRRRVLVLDRGPAGGEASAQNAGMLRRMGEDSYERALAVRTHERMRDEPDLQDASRLTGGILAFGRDPHHLHDAAAHLEVAGVPHRWSDSLGDEAPALVGAPLLGGWILPEERVVDAGALVAALRNRLRVGRGTLARAAVHGIVPGADGCTVHTDVGSFSAKQVVLAAGAWSAGLAASMGLDRPLFPLRRTLVHTAPHELAHRDHPWCWIDDEGIYARPEGAGWLISGCDEAVDFPLGEQSRGPAEAHPRALALSKLEHWLPALADARGARGWSGLRTFAPDRRPMLGADPDVPGLWWVAGLGGFGVSCGLAAGEAVAAWMNGEDVPWIRPAGVRPGRPMLRRWMIRPEGDLSGAVAHDGVVPPGVTLG